MIVTTSKGKLAGSERGGVLRFRGIPYAAPPTGSLRFRPPQELDAWSGVRDATAFGPMAPQALGSLEAMLGAGLQAQDESCLTLNVVTPGCDDARRPVMVWIHGGGFVTGAGSIPWYSGARFAERDDVVVVSINYRLGALGYTHLGPQLGEAYATAGNSGILDQVAALTWVRDEIAAFGGDPGNVTIFGESAGAMSVGTLLGMPAAGGLFHRAIAQSGAAHNSMEAGAAAEVTAELVGELGTSDPSVLLDASVDDILAAQQAVSVRYLGRRLAGQSAALRLPFQPVVDGVALPARPIDAVAGGSAAGVALVAGTNAHEFTLFTALDPSGELTQDVLLGRAEALLGEGRGAEVLAAYRAENPVGSDDDLWTALGTDWAFRIPAIRLLDAQSAHQPATFGYLFTYESTAFGGKLRSCHALDIPFVFDVVDRHGSAMFIGDIGPEAVALAGGMRSAWATFARTGTPAGQGLPEWPAYDPDRRTMMELGARPGLLHDHAPATRALWDGVI